MPKLYINGENVLFDLGNRHSMKDSNLRMKCANSTIDFKYWPRLVTLVSWLSCNKGTTDSLWYPSPTFSAFFRVHDTMKDRIPATVWLFESGDFHVLCDADITFSDESVPAGDGLLLHFKVSVDFLISQAFDIFVGGFSGAPCLLLNRHFTVYDFFVFSSKTLPNSTCYYLSLQSYVH